MSTHNIGFYEDFQLSSNTHLISSSDGHAKTKDRPEIIQGLFFLAMSVFFRSMTSF